MFFITVKGLEEMVSGPRTYEFYEKLLLRLNPGMEKKSEDKDIENLFDIYCSYTTGELAEIANRSKEYCLKELNVLIHTKKIKRLNSKNGPLWKKI
jgi:hypothetical protein